MIPPQKLEVIEILKPEIRSLYFLMFHIYMMPFVHLHVPQECYILTLKMPSEFL